MRSQPHPLNREEGILPHVYDCCISATEEDHRSVVETFGVINKFPKKFWVSVKHK